MFATLLGALPRPPLSPGVAPEAILEACLVLQAEHGLEPVTDGGWPVSDDFVPSWRATAERAGRLVKAVVIGPWTAGRSVVDVRADIVSLADAGCLWIEIHEPVAVSLAPEERTRFADAHRELTANLGGGVHLSLAVTGGNADSAGIDTILAGAYASLALDLIDGPDNWRLAVAAPTEVGVICGAVSARAGSDDGPEILLWAVDYAASSRGRGVDRVGLATAGSLADLSWESAAEKVRRLGDAARLATASREERLASIDPRAVDTRSAALGRLEPRQRPRRRKR
jgi:hypothetical protein